MRDENEMHFIRIMCCACVNTQCTQASFKTLGICMCNSKAQLMIVVLHWGNECKLAMKRWSSNNNNSKKGRRTQKRRIISPKKGKNLYCSSTALATKNFAWNRNWRKKKKHYLFQNCTTQNVRSCSIRGIVKNSCSQLCTIISTYKLGNLKKFTLYKA